MKKILVVLVFAAFALGCSGQRPPTSPEVTDAVLNAEQLGCIFGESLTDAPALARICRVAPNLIPILVPTIMNLIGQREGARHAGVAWKPVPVGDAGADASR